MSKRRLVVTAVLAGRSQSEVARIYGVSQGWISRLLARYRAEGEAAFEPRSRAPKRSPGATPPATVELVLMLRKQLAEAGLDAGGETIGWHLTHHHQTTLSPATINRILTRAGAVTPEPAKRPKSSYIRFEAEQPNECWQSDFTHYRLADDADCSQHCSYDAHAFRVYRSDMGALERYATREAEAWAKAIAGTLAVLFVATWPLDLITFGAFGPRPGALGWTLGILAEVVYFMLVIFVAAAVNRRINRRRAARQESGQVWFDRGRRCYAHGTCTIRHRSSGAAIRCRSTV